MSTITRASVVIATYNGEKYIEQQLLSIINQSVKPYEIIISDDNSKDNTLSICQRIINENYTDDIKIRLLKNDVNNKGIANNFENGFKHVTGQVVFLCDKDDIWMPNKIETMLELMNKTKKKLAFHNAEIILENDSGGYDKTGRTLFENNGLQALSGESTILDRERYYPISLRFCFIQGMCICIDAEYLRSILPLSEYKNHDDWLLFCAMFDDSVAATGKILSYYRIHSSNNAGLAQYKKKKTLAEKINDFEKQSYASINNLYGWSKDVADYAENEKIPDDNINRIYEFYKINRINALKKHKLAALASLNDLKKQGVYEIDGKIMFYHDLLFCTFKSARKRKKIIESICSSYKSRIQ